MRILAEPTRLRVLQLLRPGELNVSSLCEHLGLAQPTVSHHLGLLRDEGLVTSRREGKHVFYALNRHAVVGGNARALSIDLGMLELRLNHLSD
jgi:DNA-binding transcriptional ArsR family regulator